MGLIALLGLSLHGLIGFAIKTSDGNLTVLQRSLLSTEFLEFYLADLFRELL